MPFLLGKEPCFNVLDVEYLCLPITPWGIWTLIQVVGDAVSVAVQEATPCVHLSSTGRIGRVIQIVQQPVAFFPILTDSLVLSVSLNLAGLKDMSRKN